MEATDHARHIYEDAADATDGQTLESLASTLEHRARLVRGEQEAQDVREASDEVRGEIAQALTDVPALQRERIADQLEETAETLKKVFGNANPKAQELPGDTAAEARLESDEMRVDPRKIPQGNGNVVDEQIAEGIRVHEEEHNKQKVHADAGEISVRGKTFDQREIREAAAIGVQKEESPQSIEALSGEYRAIAASLVMEGRHRSLVRQGRFRELETVMNGGELAA